MGLLLNILVKYFFSDLRQLLPRQHQGATQGGCVAVSHVQCCYLEMNPTLGVLSYAYHQLHYILQYM